MSPISPTMPPIGVNASKQTAYVCAYVGKPSVRINALSSKTVCANMKTTTKNDKPVPTLKELGLIMLKEAGEEACKSGYGTIDPEWVGRYALQFGDIRRNGELN